MKNQSQKINIRSGVIFQFWWHPQRGESNEFRVTNTSFQNRYKGRWSDRAGATLEGVFLELNTGKFSKCCNHISVGFVL